MNTSSHVKKIVAQYTIKDMQNCMAIFDSATPVTRVVSSSHSLVGLVVGKSHACCILEGDS